jgi:hypothetical protein
MDSQCFQFAKSVERVLRHRFNAIIRQQQIVQMNLMLECVIRQIRDPVVTEISVSGIGFFK